MLIARINFRVRAQDAHVWVLTGLAEELRRCLPENVFAARFNETAVATILELELHIATESFAEAETVAQAFISSAEPLQSSRFRAEATQMSTGISPG
ncbi:hypothetical protein [Nesterenkonia suensis]